MNQNSFVILGFIENLMFSTRVESVVESLGFKMEWMEQGDQDSALSGENTLLNRIIQLAPVLILVDLGMGAISWGTVIQQIKSTPSTKQIPVICFGSHMDADTLKLARQAGADEVVARSRFFSALPKLIQGHIPSK